MMSSRPTTGVATSWQARLLTMLSLVLVLALAFPAAGFSQPGSHIGMASMTTQVDGTGEADQAPCHPASHQHDEMSGSDHPVASTTSHHDAMDGLGDCCAVAACSGSCASVCSGIGANATLPGSLAPLVGASGEPVVSRVEDNVLPGLSEAPFRPPITEPTSPAS